MTDSIIAIVVCTCLAMLMVLVGLNYLSGCGVENGSCITVEDFIAGVEK
ncbi:hypothetical protein [Sneathiella glossodoripedis]|nr:hypothetical protein [Sneathiella glossodoripedis]